MLGTPVTQGLVRGVRLRNREAGLAPVDRRVARERELLLRKGQASAFRALRLRCGVQGLGMGVGFGVGVEGCGLSVGGWGLMVDG